MLGVGCDGETLLGLFASDFDTVAFLVQVELLVGSTIIVPQDQMASELTVLADVERSA